MPWTTIELADALVSLTVAPEVVGVDLDPANVARALPLARSGLRFVVGGFTLPDCARPALLVRAMNVLRGYPREQISSAHAEMGSALVCGGLLVEGSSGPTGDVLTAHLIRRTDQDLRFESLLFSTDFSRGFAPLLFRDRLPRDLRGYTRDSPVGDLFHQWEEVYREVRGLADSPGERFFRCAERLALARADIAQRPELWRQGAMLWAR